MSVKRLTKFALAALCLALPAFAQIDVSQNPEDYAMFSSIQAAVNAAQSGQTITILDAATYREQVTIDSTKHGITLRSRNPTALQKPVIIWKDTVNRSPKNYAESQVPGDKPGSSGNFETCGALRIKRAKGVTIDGITVDGGGAAPFAWPNVWNSMDALAHGNAAITLVVAGNAVIRNCELRNAYIGLNVKDRNTGGVFGNPNPADNDETIPLSGFGKVGSHLIEYNRIHDNSLGIFFESAWDLGSTVRYNLIYNNFHVKSVLDWITSVDGKLGSENNNLPACGAIMFKDMVYTPVAIYNNTFYNNKMNLIGHWKIAAPHLLFNNIFGKSSVTVDASTGQQATGFGNISFMAMDMAFTNRQHNSVTSAYLSIAAQGQKVHFNGCTPEQYDTLWIRDITVWNQYPAAEKTPQNIFAPGCQTAYSENMVVSGALLEFPLNANMRWLEMSKVTITSSQAPGKSLVLPDLFQSTDPANPRFLWPDWEHPLVKEYIQNKGWETAGVRNADGNIADIGAISSNNNVHQPTLARITPTSVVMITGTNAKVSFTLELKSGTMTNPKIKLLRWVAPLPEASNFGGSSATPLAASSIHNITLPGTAIKVGTNTFDVTLPSGTVPQYGFFELIIEGTGANGQTVSDVGFLPYRELEYILDIRVFKGTTEVKEVTAGEPVTLRVTAINRKTGEKFTAGAPTTPLQVEYSLIDPASRIWRQVEPALGNALAYDPNLAPAGGTSYEKSYNPVYFTKAGDETIKGAGLWCDNCNDENALRRVFLGTLDIKVKPGAPDKVVFLNPMPKSQIPAGVLPPTISGTYNVEVQVQDRFDNPVDVAVPVRIVSESPDIADIDAPATVSTDVADGIARFTARVTNGKTGNIFDMTASIDAGRTRSDVGSLRVGRATDFLRVFYYNSDKHGVGWHDDYDEVEEVNDLTGTLRPVWVKLTSSAGDTVITSRASFICVSSVDGLLFSLTEGGPGVPGPVMVPMTGGVAKFWVTSGVEVEDASISASARTSADCDGVKDNGINDGSRGRITFRPPAGGVGTAFVKGDRYGRPNYVEITFAGEGGGGFNAVPKWHEPDSVKLSWPGVCDGAVNVKSTTFDYKDDGVTVGVTFDPSGFPEGYSAPMNSTPSLVIYGAMDLPESKPNTLIDSIGPLIARVRPVYCAQGPLSNPTFEENKSPEVTPYVLSIQTTEPLANINLLVGNSILISSDSLGTNPNPLTVDAVADSGGIYMLTLSPTSLLTEGFWIRFNPSRGAGEPDIIDASGVKVDPDNRWVQIKMQETPANINDAWYTTADNTGIIDYIYITFDKGLTEDDIPAWFSGGKFTFTWMGTGGFSVDAANIGSISVVPPGTNTIRIDVQRALTPAEVNRMMGGAPVKTSGNITVDVEFSSGKGWKNVDKPARDAANPVLVSAVLQMGTIDANGVETSDTLILTYSERMGANLTEIPVPVKFASKASPTVWNDVSLQAHGSPSEDARTGFVEMRYVVPLGGSMEAGDSLRINELAGVADNFTPPNVQDNPDNRRVPLEIRANVNWTTIVKKNPFRDFTTLVMTPNFKGGALGFNAKVKLYDNMGKLVVDKDVPNKRDGTNAAEWVWDGRNSNGRFVGTGTYLYVVDCTPDAESAQKGVERYSARGKIGFVRGVGK